jgi:hypothetical protein
MVSPLKHRAALGGVLLVLIVLMAAVTKINLKEQSTPPGTNGQLLFNNNGVTDAEDPVVSQATASLLNAQVVGNIASAGSDSGNPVKIGCVFNTTQPTVTTGQRVDCQSTNRGAQIVAAGVDGFPITFASAQPVTQSGNWSTRTQDGSGNNITSTSSALDVNIKSSGLSNQSINYNQMAGAAVVADPCKTNTPTYDSFSLTANTRLIVGTAAKKIYFCSFNIVVGAATNVAIVEGTGSTCGTGTAKLPGLSGGTTAAGGWNFAANGGLTFGNGDAALAQEGTSADDVCILVSAANQVTGAYKYVVQ